MLYVVCLATTSQSNPTYRVKVLSYINTPTLPYSITSPGVPSHHKTMEPLHQPPTLSSFTPLALHQSQTPESFYSGPPVLHHHSPSASLFFHASDLAAAPAALSGLANGAGGGGARRRVNGEAAVVNGDGGAEDEDEDEELEVEGVDVWVTSEYVVRVPPRFVRTQKPVYLCTYVADSQNCCFSYVKAFRTLLAHPLDRPLDPVPHHLPARPPAPFAWETGLPVPAAPYAGSDVRRS